MDLQAGEIVTVTRKWSDTWYYGYTNERVGRFPAKYVTDDLSRIVYVRKRPPYSRFYVRARYDYTPAAEKRMTLIKNEIIEILWILSGNWYEGRSLDGKRKGSVPVTFVREIRNGHDDW
ncbi:Vinexin [Serendipita sp. 405]|nr:Vinexin [Serendipita sp. 397]KAG8847797.1 Vinexin [Serendipita sp. 405]